MDLAFSSPGNRIARARGSIDQFESAGDAVIIRGWILHPDLTFNSAAVTLDGGPAAGCELTQRPDVAAAFPHLSHALLSGFAVRLPYPTATGPTVAITVEGKYAGNSRASFSWHAPGRSRVNGHAVPAEHLRVRVAGNPDAESFLQVGCQAAMMMMRAVEQHAPGGRPWSLLDWGCGSGRVTAAIVELHPDLKLSGCDLDAEAITWCNQHIRAGAFHVTGPYPPLPFADQSFDAVLACSVMTHLPWSVQKKWLAEIRRVLRPGGVFVATVHGRFAAAFLPGELARLDRKGIIERHRDAALDGIAPRNYYRGVFQTPAFTQRHWSRGYELVDYVEGGLAAFQDLVVLRRSG